MIWSETRAVGADSIDRFYRDFKVAETAYYSERGPRNEREQEMVKALPYMRQVSTRLSEYRREERAVHTAKTWRDLFEFGTRNMPADQKITPEERRELLDLLMYEQINIVRAAYGKPPID